MRKIVITKEQYQRIFETGSNSAAMDLDIYVQPVDYDTSDGNEGIEDSVQSIMGKLKELNSLFDSGKKIKSYTKNKIYKIVDDLNTVYDETIENP